MSRFSKGKILHAIENNLEPASIAEIARVSISFSDTEFAPIKVKYPNANLSVLLGQLCQASINYSASRAGVSAPRDASSKPRPAVSIVDKDFRNKEGQFPFYDNLKKGMDAGMIVLAEGATGLGKSRVLARIANEKARAGEGPVIIAAPTINIMKHIFGEWKDYGNNNGIHLGVMLGKAQFFVPEIVNDLLTNNIVEIKETDRLQRINEWLRDGAPPLAETGSLALQDGFPDISYITEDLLFLAPEFDGVPGYTIQDIADEEDDKLVESPVYEVFDSMKQFVGTADILLVSHAKLAFDLRLRSLSKGRAEEERPEGEKIQLLGDYKTLLLDEGHEFEKAMAAVETQTITISTLRIALKKSNLGTSGHRSNAVAVCDDIQKWSKNQSENEFFIFYGDWDKASAAVKSFMALAKRLYLHMQQIVSDTKKSYTYYDQVLRTDFYRLRKIITQRPTVKIEISFIRKFLAIATGPVNMKATFAILWDRLISAGIVSGTMTLPNALGVRDASYIKRLLNIPETRIYLPAKVTPKWVTAAVKLHVPAAAELPLLEFPSMNGNETRQQILMRQYISNLTDKIFSIVSKAPGGTLVAMTAYQLINDLANSLLAIVAPDRLIIHMQGQSFKAMEHAFQGKYKAGLKPVWLALGPAWTGLDLVDMEVEAHDDNLLSDLIIPKLPFGVNQTFTAKIRERRVVDENGKVGALPVSDRNEAAFLFRQGLGRAVRREYCPQKNIWVLDSRIWLRNDRFYGVFKRIMDEYPKA